MPWHKVDQKIRLLTVRRASVTHMTVSGTKRRLMRELLYCNYTALMPCEIVTHLERLIEGMGRMG